MQDILFYIFSFAMLFFGVLTIASHNPVRSALCLIMVFFFMSGLFTLLHAFFLAAVQILVYAGAIMVLFLFVIMLLNIKDEERHQFHWFGLFGSALAIPILIANLIFLGKSNEIDLIIPQGNLIGTTEAIGKLLFSKYLLPFEITSLLLLIAMIGVIILSKKDVKS